MANGEESSCRVPPCDPHFPPHCCDSTLDRKSSSILRYAHYIVNFRPFLPFFPTNMLFPGGTKRVLLLFIYFFFIYSFYNEQDTFEETQLKDGKEAIVDF